MTTSRRRFLILSASAIATTSLVACSDDPADNADTGNGTDTGTDTGGGDTDQDTGTDTGLDTGLNTGDTEDTGEGDGSGDGSDGPELLPVSKGPWCMVAGLTSIRLRVETREDWPLTVTLSAPGGGSITEQFGQNTEDIELDWPPAPFQADYPDEPGDHTLHEILFTDLEPGVRYSYSISAGDYEAREGSFRAPPASGEPFRITWVADTMFPVSQDTSVLAASTKPDLYLHGGDIQYMTNPLDTWNGYFRFFADVLAHAASHHAIGNHEYEDRLFDEFESHYVRLFGGQGEEDSEIDYFAFTFGSLRFVFLNSEIDFGVPETPQSIWLEAELAATLENDSILYTVVAFHRPLYTFSKSKPNLERRAYLHDLFLNHNVRLVLQGHNHGYERFLVDGIHYVLDAGGGAALNDQNGNYDSILAERPEEIPLRLVESHTYGVLILDVAADGTITAERHSLENGIIDAFTVTPEPEEDKNEGSGDGEGSGDEDPS